jgi:hypothetical protein
VVTELCNEIIIDIFNGYIGIPLIDRSREGTTRILGDVGGFILTTPPAKSERRRRGYDSMAMLAKHVREQIDHQKQKFTANQLQRTIYSHVW